MLSLDFITQLLRDHQIAFLFPATVIEGPIVTVIASFLASTGALNLGLVFLVALVGDFFGDLLYYGLGRFGRERLLERYGKYLGVERRHILRAEEYIHENAFKAMFVAKISHVVGLAILFSLGLFRMNLTRFFFSSISIGVPKTALFVGIGYFFGGSYTMISQYLNLGSSILVFFASFFLIYKAFYYFKWKAKTYGTE